ncbi:hypothetical protein EXZ61_12950 [Rhodoferax aquaticus]|uniref:Uncharacterized protein n=1 Tax=Rhodoferax aquaticus TaxID=2527691 RepID=A0A515EQQ3_9BURK|nr:hypothetical protein EXZ61_12950 [Rhodoferax aquaticus]
MENQKHQPDWIAINAAVARIKGEHGFTGDLLSQVQLAQIMNKPVKFVWNLKARGQMPQIPVITIGNRDTFWIVHVVMWMMNTPMSSMPVFGAAPEVPKPPVGEMDRPKRASRESSVNESARAEGRRKEVSLAKAALLAKGLKILEERSRSK